mmetsp:Transcript_33157/g.78641  ORF Transcript_33157/g.78641 Transcript_33157/m.78641 type:complete len:233 (-) Transcript_33157:512-1210(-)
MVLYGRCHGDRLSWSARSRSPARSWSRNLSGSSAQAEGGPPPKALGPAASRAGGALPRAARQAAATTRGSGAEGSTSRRVWRNPRHRTSATQRRSTTRRSRGGNPARRWSSCAHSAATGTSTRASSTRGELCRRSGGGVGSSGRSAGSWEEAGTAPSGRWTTARRAPAPKNRSQRRPRVEATRPAARERRASRGRRRATSVRTPPSGATPLRRGTGSPSTASGTRASGGTLC